MINRVLGMSHLDYVTLNKKGAKVHDHKAKRGIVYQILSQAFFRYQKFFDYGL